MVFNYKKINALQALVQCHFYVIPLDLSRGHPLTGSWSAYPTPTPPASSLKKSSDRPCSPEAILRYPYPLWKLNINLLFCIIFIIIINENIFSLFFENSSKISHSIIFWMSLSNSQSGRLYGKEYVNGASAAVPAFTPLWDKPCLKQSWSKRNPASSDPAAKENTCTSTFKKPAPRFRQNCTTLPAVHLVWAGIQNTVLLNSQTSHCCYSKCQKVSSLKSTITFK